MKEDRQVNRLYASAGVIALAALLGWTSYQILSSRLKDPYADCRSGNVAGGPIGGAFELIDAAGKTVTDQSIFNKPALVYFGYTSCVDVCPLDNARNVDAASQLATLGFEVTPVFISVDPKRDTPQVLAEYAANFGDTLVGLTGTPDQIKAAANAFKVFYSVPENPTPDEEVQHTTLTYLMLPGTGFADFYLRETSAAEIAERAGCFLKSS